MRVTQGPRRMIRAGALVIVVAIAAVLILNWVAVEVRTVRSGSMQPTLSAGERVVVVKAGVDRWAVPPGELVVFDAANLWTEPGDPEGSVFVKRVVAVGGDRIVCCTAQGQLLRNGVAVDEPYLGAVTSDQQVFDVRVRADHYWVMGDNRSDSSDSRAHLGDPGGGNVPASRIIGTAEAVVWPLDAVRRLEAPDE